MIKVVLSNAADPQGNASTLFTFYQDGRELVRFIIEQPADRDLVAVLHNGGAEVHDLREPVSTTTTTDLII